MNLTRKSFVLGCTAAMLDAEAASCEDSREQLDPYLSVFLSDAHVARSGIVTEFGPQTEYQEKNLENLINEIVQMRPKPSRVVVFGDLSLWLGFRQDYEVAKNVLDRLSEAGITLFLTAGNHDHRKVMRKCFSVQGERSAISDRFVAKIDLGTSDLILLDTLQENPRGEGSRNPVSGVLDDDQQEWLRNMMSVAPRPFFVGAHHDPGELMMCGENIVCAMERSPMYLGFIHGHHHRYGCTWHNLDYSSRRVSQIVSLPSTGCWGDIGYVVMRTSDDGALMSLVEKDFFFPKPLDENEKRPTLWKDIVERNRGATVAFRY